MNKHELMEYLLKEEKKAFTGWDFSYLDGRYVDTEPPWNYKDIIGKYNKPNYKLLDMGTGGGEFIRELGHPYSLISVTESYEPNLTLCRKVLSPLGIDVRKTGEEEKLPFDDESFDIVINRHESFAMDEVRRVLKKQGYFITQQVGGKNNTALSKRLIEDFKEPFPDHDLKHNIELIEKSGFTILESGESFLPSYFHDIGAVVYLAKILVWEFPRFSVSKCFDKLWHMEEELSEKGFIEAMEHRFYIAAMK
ncbi:class I SAM-dependent methyltransferase [Anaeropeptidivorans aminofermentans]|uniref:class I SAM-dependent methyltransferase n=1 Tax=Anaeropeptidivorans aminofermentans TaxID=2934315 RepID=UPI0020248A4D|nr:class I SAM-dependent methyltransferase [Anaeropeptidivorans aminofermentans]